MFLDVNVIERIYYYTDIESRFKLESIFNFKFSFKLDIKMFQHLSLPKVPIQAIDSDLEDIYIYKLVILCYTIQYTSFKFFQVYSYSEYNNKLYWSIEYNSDVINDYILSVDPTYCFICNQAFGYKCETCNNGNDCMDAGCKGNCNHIFVENTWIDCGKRELEF